jgi:hypothetical protein
MRRLKRAGLLIALLLATFVDQAQAQSDYPSKPIHLIVGFTPGSVADITARVLGNRMGQLLGQQVVVENKVGAGSNIAAEYVARSPKDGYTLFLPGSANIANAAISSFTLWTPSEGCTTRITAALLTSAIGAKSLMISNGSFELIAALAMLAEPGRNSV